MSVDISPPFFTSSSILILVRASTWSTASSISMLALELNPVEICAPVGTRTPTAAFRQLLPERRYSTFPVTAVKTPCPIQHGGEQHHGPQDDTYSSYSHILLLLYNRIKNAQSIQSVACSPNPHP